MENAYLVYILKVSFSLGILTLIYFSFFRNDTLNRLRRFFLLFTILFSVIYPFLQFSFLPQETDSLINQIQLAQVEINPTLTDANHTTQFSIQSVVANLVILISLVVLVRFIVQLIAVLSLIRRGRSFKMNGYDLVYLDQTITPFSFFNKIFISDRVEDYNGLQMMIRHEQAHVRQKHSLDIIVSELFCVAFWWNPLAWVLRKEIKVNVEYLADNEVLNSGADKRQYQFLLLQTIQNNASIYIINEFNVSQLKKRITMINKNETSRILSIKYLLIIPIVLFLIVANATAKDVVSSIAETVVSNDIQDGVKDLKVGGDEKDKPFISVEVMPRYQGGDNALMKFISENLKYPELAVKNKTEGRVVVRFTISKTGQVSDVRILRTLSPDCDTEAIRVVSAMPNWIPGKQNGNNVSVYYTLPVQFKLTKKK